MGGGWGVEGRISRLGFGGIEGSWMSDGVRIGAGWDFALKLEDVNVILGNRTCLFL